MKYKNHLIVLLVVLLVASTFGIINFFGSNIKRTWATTGQMFGYYCDLLGNPGSNFKEMGHGYVDQLQSMPSGDKLFVSWVDKVAQNAAFGTLKAIYLTRGSWQEPILVDENVKDAKPYILPIDGDNLDIYKNHIIYTKDFITGSQIFIKSFDNLHKTPPPANMNGIGAIPPAGTFNYAPSMTIKPDGSPIVAWVTVINNVAKIAVSCWSIQSQAWTDLNGNIMPHYELINIPPPFGGMAKDPTIIYDKNGNLLICFTDASPGGSDLFVIKRTQTGWVNYMTGGPIMPAYQIAGQAKCPTIKHNLNGEFLTLGWLDNGGAAYFAKKNYNTNLWSGIGNNPAPYRLSPPGVSYETFGYWISEFVEDGWISYGLGYGHPWGHLELKWVEDEEKKIINIKDLETLNTQCTPSINNNQISTLVAQSPFASVYYVGSDSSTTFLIAGSSPESLTISWPTIAEVVPMNSHPWDNTGNAQVYTVNVCPDGFSLSVLKITNAIARCNPTEVDLKSTRMADVEVSFVGIEGAGTGFVEAVIDTLPTGVTAYISPSIGRIDAGTGFKSNLHITIDSSILQFDKYVAVLLKNSEGNTIATAYVRVIVNSIIFRATSPGDSSKIIVYPGTQRHITYAIDYTNLGTYDTINLSSSDVPTGITLTWDPQSLAVLDNTRESTLKIEVGENVPSGSYVVTLNLAVPNKVTLSQKLTIVVKRYSVVSYDNDKYLTISQTSVEWNVDVIPANTNFTGKVYLSMVNLPNNVTYNISPGNPIELNGATVVATITLNIPTGILDHMQNIFYLEAKSEKDDSEYLALYVTRGNFKINTRIYHDRLLTGSKGGWEITIDNFSAIAGTAYLQVEDLPTGWTSCFDTNTLQFTEGGIQSAMVNVRTGGSAGSYSFKVRVTLGSESELITINVEVCGFEVYIQTSEILEVYPGEEIILNVMIKSINGYSGYVDVTASVNPYEWWVYVKTPEKPVKCEPNSMAQTEIIVKLDGNSQEYEKKPVSLSVSGKDLGSEYTGICTLLGGTGNIVTMSPGAAKIKKELNTSILIKFKQLNEQTGEGDCPIVFECEPYKIIRQVAHRAGQAPVNDYSVTIPFLGMNIHSSGATASFEYIEVLLPSGLSSCKWPGSYQKLEDEIVFKQWDVYSNLPPMYNTEGYCDAPEGPPQKIYTQKHAKKAIGMPTPTTIHPASISSVWQKTYSSEDIGQPCTNNVCIQDIRRFVYSAPDFKLEDMPDLDPPVTVTIPLRAYFTVGGTGDIYQKRYVVTKFCEITYEKPLPTHSMGGEKIVCDYLVGDTHCHSACGKLQKENCPTMPPFPCLNTCDCTNPANSEGDKTCEIGIPSGPSMTLRAEQAREFNFDFNYCADHSNGDGECTDDAFIAYKGLITKKDPQPGKSPSGGCQVVEYNIEEGCGDPDVLCTCTREKAYIDTFDRDMVTIGKGMKDGLLVVNAQEVATKPNDPCNKYRVNSHASIYYQLNYIENFEFTKPELMQESGAAVNKYASCIISHMHEPGCMTPLLFEDEEYPLTSEPKNPLYPGFWGFPWDYPGCNGENDKCDPWAEWGDNPPYEWGHRAKFPLKGYDGMELIYYDWTAKEQTYEKWKDEIERTIPYTINNHPLSYNWANGESQPPKFERDIWHPFPVATSNILRWWMGPFNRFWGKNVTYIKGPCPPSVSANDIGGSGLVNPIGYYLRHGKTIASGGGSFATMYLGAYVDTEPRKLIGINPENLGNEDCATLQDCFQPGDMIYSDMKYRCPDTKVKIRILAKSAWSYGTPSGFKMYLHRSPNQETLVASGDYSAFNSWTFYNCPPGPPIDDGREVWWFKDVVLQTELSGQWALRLEVYFSNPTAPAGNRSETIYTAPIYSKY